MKLIVQFLFRNKARGALGSVTTVAIMMLIFSSIAVLYVEPPAEGSNISTPGDAIWWSFVTITTVGYGDYYPVTIEGRFLAAVLMTLGVGLFGTFTAYVASLFVHSDIDSERADRDKYDELLAEVQDLKRFIRQSETFANTANAGTKDDK